MISRPLELTWLWLPAIVEQLLKRVPPDATHLMPPDVTWCHLMPCTWCHLMSNHPHRLPFMSPNKFRVLPYNTYRNIFHRWIAPFITKRMRGCALQIEVGTQPNCNLFDNISQGRNYGHYPTVKMSLITLAFDRTESRSIYLNYRPFTDLSVSIPISHPIKLRLIASRSDANIR